MCLSISNLKSYQIKNPPLISVVTWHLYMAASVVQQVTVRLGLERLEFESSSQSDYRSHVDVSQSNIQITW